LPPYAELQRAETAYMDDHLAHGVPDLRVATLAARYEELLETDLPLDVDELDRLRSFAARFAELCAELETRGIAETLQHDDLHMGNVYERDGRLRVLDWGDSSVSHPFASLVVTFRMLERTNDLSPTDPWFDRLRDAYLEPWGSGLTDTFALALRVGSFAHTFAWARQREAMEAAERARFDEVFAVILRRALAYADS
jgi:aminoglycoside phosphotransferase (APT) family kinase protein